MPQVDMKIPHLTVQVAEHDLPEHWVAQVDWALVVRQHRFLKYVSTLDMCFEIVFDQDQDLSLTLLLMSCS